MKPYLSREQSLAIQRRHTAAEHAACVDVPTEVLEKVRVTELLEENALLRARFLESTGQLIEENEALRALLENWLRAGGQGTFYPQPDLAARTRAAIFQQEGSDE